MIVVLVAAYSARYTEESAAQTADLQSSFRELLALQAESSSEVDVEELWRQF
jgi:hypothetical protein